MFLVKEFTLGEDSALETDLLNVECLLKPMPFIDLIVTPSIWPKAFLKFVSDNASRAEVKEDLLPAVLIASSIDAIAALLLAVILIV